MKITKKILEGAVETLNELSVEQYTLDKGIGGYRLIIIEEGKIISGRFGVITYTKADSLFLYISGLIQAFGVARFEDSRKKYIKIES